MKVFLGGTCSTSLWRDELIPLLTIPYFNPVVPDWSEAAQAEELFQRSHCSHLLYTLTPKMEGYYSIAELVEDSVKRPSSTLACLLPRDGSQEFTPFQWKSLSQVLKLVSRNGVRCFNSLSDVAFYLNNPTFSPSSILSKPINL